MSLTTLGNIRQFEPMRVAPRPQVAEPKETPAEEDNKLALQVQSLGDDNCHFGSYLRMAGRYLRMTLETGNAASINTRVRTLSS
jgi:uncharacterized membrane protein